MKNDRRKLEKNTNPDLQSNKWSQPQKNRQETWENLTTEYLYDLLHQLNEINNSLQVKDYTTIKNQAHRGKGTSATYRLNSISQNFAQLESQALSQNQVAITDTINKIKQLVKLELNRMSS